MSDYKQIKIFYTDDDEDDRFTFEEAIGDVNMPVALTCFVGGRQLEEALFEQEYRCDLIFLDLNMPGWSGIETLRSLQSAIEDKGLKIIIFTTSADDSLILQTFELKAVRFLQKPVDYDILIRSLKKIIEDINHLQVPVQFKDFQFFLTHE